MHLHGKKETNQWMVIVIERIHGTPLMPFVPQSNEHICTQVKLLTNFYKIWCDEVEFWKIAAIDHGHSFSYESYKRKEFKNLF